MATWNGAYNGGGRIEYVYTVGTVSQNTTSVTVSVTAYLRMQGNNSSNGSWPMSWSGAWGSGSSSPSNSIGAGGRVQIRSWSGSVTLTDSTQSRAFQISAQHYWGTTSATLNVSIPARYARTPTGLTVERTSDSRAVIRWTRQGTYTSVAIQFRHNLGNGWGSWTGAGTASGNASSYTKTSGLYGDRAYQFRVQGRNAGGASAWSGASAVIYMTPGQVTQVSATRSGSGIRVTSTALTPHATHFDIERDGSGIVGSIIARGSLPWTYSNPDLSQTHRFRMRGRVASGGVGSTTLIGAWSGWSNTVQLAAPPNRPTNLSPNGGVVAVGESARYSWRHNPVDSSEQTGYLMSYQPVGGGLTSLPVVSSDEFHTLTLDDPGDYEWMVRTRGAHASYSDVSAVATVTAISVPTVAITTPDDGIWTEPTLTAAWSYSQDEGRPQTGWRVELLDLDADSVLVNRTGVGAQNSFLLPVRLVRETHYRLRVWVQHSGVWSDYDEMSFETEFVPPVPPTTEGGWNEETGQVDLFIYPGTDPLLEDTVRVRVERSVDSGATWQLVEDDLPVDGDLHISDSGALSYGTTLYRVTGFSIAGEAAETEWEITARSEAVWINYGDGFANTVRLPYEVRIEPVAGRDGTDIVYRGRSAGVPYASSFVDNRVVVSGVVFDREIEGSATRAELRAAAVAGSPAVFYRDPAGHCFPARMQPVQFTPWRHGRPDRAWAWTTTVKEVAV